MKYNIDYHNDINKTMLFWCERFIRSKLTSLSNSSVSDKDSLSNILKMLVNGTNDIEELKTIVKQARNIGLAGINTYFNPIYKLYNYIRDLNIYTMKDIDEDILSDFLATSTSGLSDATKKNHKIAIVNFFSYIDRQNESSSNNVYLYNIQLKNWGGLGGNKGTKLPSFMNKIEIDTFISHLDTYKFSNKIKARNKLIIKIILYTGIRVSEAINLKIKDLFQEKDVYLLQIRGKGNKPRVVMIKASVIQDDLKQWMDLRSCENNLLLCNSKAKPLTQSYISRTVEKILLSCGIRKEKNGAHMLRHSFATLLYNKHQDLILVQEALGHADINTSRIYTHFDTNRLKKTTDLI